jgi:AP-2 complex subunit sigma-1
LGAGREGLTGYVQVYAILDEVFLAGEIEETSKQVVLTRLEHLDKLE